MKKIITLLLALCPFVSVSQAQVPNYVPTNGLVAWYPFNGNANDESGNGNNGVVTGATLTSDRFGISGKAYDFNGINNLITVNNVLLSNSPTSLTVSLWFKTSDIDGFLINDYQLGPNTTKYGLTINQVSLYRNISSGCENGNCAGPCGVFTSNVIPSECEWHHAVLVKNMATNTSVIYLDNVIVATRNNYCYISQNTPTIIGKTLNGQIDDVAIWNRALTPNEISNLFVTSTAQNLNLIQQDTISTCGNSVTINATPGLSSYSWSGGGNTASKTVTSTGWYSLTASNGTCTATDSVFVSIINSQIQQNDTTICSGASLTLSVAGTANIGQTPCASNLLPANLQNGLIGYWPFCGNANDASGNGNNGVVNGATLTTDRNGNANSAYSFNGVLNKIVVGNNLPFANNSFSISLFARKNYPFSSNFSTMLSNGNGSFSTSNALSLIWENFLYNNGNGHIGLHFYGPDLSTNYALTDTNWVHFCFTFDHQTHIRKIFINSVLAAIDTTNTNYLGSGNTYFGQNSYNYNSGTDAFKGKLDDIGIWNRALTDLEVASLYNSGNNMPQTYLWSTGDTNATINVNPTQSTNYWVQVSNGITTCTDTIHVTVNNFSNLIAQDTISACGNSVTINATPGLPSYSWIGGGNTASKTVSTTGWYSLIASNGTCTVTDSVFVSLVNAQIQQNDTTICSGSTLTLSVAGSANIGQTPCSSSLLPANLQNGLVGYWPFCGNANDQSGNGNNGVLNGTIITADRFGNSNNAYNFNGNSYITIPNSQSLQVGNSMSISIWLKYNSLQNYLNWILSKGIGGGCPTDGYYLTFDNGGGPQYNKGMVYGFGNNYCATISNMGMYVDSSWHNFTIVYNPPSGNNLFIDGVLIAQDYAPCSTCAIINSLNPLYIGKVPNVSGSGWNGILDDLYIWNRSLSNTEIQQLYNNLSNVTQTYLWSTGDTTMTININPTQSTNYWVQVSNGITTCTDTIHITINNFANLIAQDTISACGNSVTINATPGLSSYSWSGGGNTASKTVTATGWYSLTASNGTCTAMDSVFVSLVNAQILQNDTTICSGTTIQLNVQLSTSDSIDLYNNFIFSAVDTISGKYRIWRKPSLNQPYQSLFNDNFHRLHVIMSSDMNEMIYVRYKRSVLNPPVLPMSTQTLDSAWVCRNNSFGTNEQVLFLVPNFNRDAIYSLDWSSDKTRILFTKSNDNYPNGSTRDGDVFEFNLISNTIINITNDWDIMDFRAKYINNSYDFIYTKLGAPVAGFTEYAYKFTRSSNTESIFIDGLGYNYDNTIVILNTISSDGQKVLYRRRGNQFLYSKLLSGGNEQLVQAKKGLGTTDFNNYYFDVSINSNYIRVSTNSSQIDSFNVPQIVNFAQDYSYASFHDILYISDLKFLGKWSFVNGNVVWSSGDTTATINVNPTQSTTYWVQVSNGITTCTDTIHITVNQPVLSINASPNDTVCTGQTITLSGQGASTYTWSGGVNNGVGFVPASSATYTVTGTDASGCSATKSIAIVVQSAPNVTANANPTNICLGNTSTLSATSGFSYTWQPGNLTGSPVVSPNITTTYTVTATNANGCSNTATKTVVVNPLPSVATTANPSAICIGATSVLSATGGTSYTWQPGGLTGSPTVSPSTTTTYTVTTVNANGCSNTASQTIVVNSLPVVSATANPSTICFGVSSVLNGTGGTNYTWQPGGLTGSPSVSPNITTTYTVTATNANGCSNTATQTLVVNTLPTVSASANPSSICIGASSVLSATGGTSYTWQPGGLSGSPSVSPTNTTTYTVTAVNANGCSNTATQTIVVNTLPMVSALANPSSICIGSSSVLSATGGTSYTWQPGGLTGSPSVSPTSTTTYTVTAVNANGCSNTATRTVVVNPSPVVSASANPTAICIGASSVLSAIGGISYTWQPGGLTGSPSVSPNITTTYTVTAVNANGCSNTTTQTIVVNSLPSVSTTANPTVVCIGATSVLSATGGTSYTWQPGGLSGSPSVSPTNTTTYTVTAVNANGCSNTATQTIVVNSLPNVSALANPSSICIGASSVLSATGGTSYTWQPGGLTGSPSVSPITTTTYTVTAVNANGCSNTATQTIVVNSLPIVSASANPSSICFGSSSVLIATGGTSYTWQPGGLTGSPSVSPTNTTTYTVTAVNANGCSNTATQTIVVNLLPTVTASANPSAICLGASSVLSAIGGTAYIWQPGNLTGSPSVSPNTTTTYTVTASNANGCSNTATVTIDVINGPSISVNASPASVCLGGSTTLSALGGQNYIWQPGSLGGSPTVSPTVTTTYTVTASNAQGCTNVGTLTVTVNNLPTISAAANPNNVCAGSTTQLSASGGTSYQWQPGNLVGAPVVNPTVATTYTVVGTDNNGCSNSNTVSIQVNALPNVAATINPNVICAGGWATLQGTGATSYYWMPGNIFGAPTVFPNVTTTYTVTGTSANGCTATSSATLTVDPPPVITQNPTLQVSVNGGSAQFTVQCNNPNATYLWQRDNGFGFQSLSNGGQFSGVNTNTLTVTNLTQANNGNLYRCQVSLPGCNVYSLQAILKVEFALGLEQQNTNPSIQIYPNPANTTLHIHTEPDAIGSQLLIRDLSGRVCYTQTLENENTTIPVGAWARGLYMLNVISNKGNWVYRVVLSD